MKKLEHHKKRCKRLPLKYLENWTSKNVREALRLFEHQLSRWLSKRKKPKSQRFRLFAKNSYRVGESNSALLVFKILFHDYQNFVRAIYRQIVFFDHYFGHGFGYCYFTPILVIQLMFKLLTSTSITIFTFSPLTILSFGVVNSGVETLLSRISFNISFSASARERFSHFGFRTVSQNSRALASKSIFLLSI